MMFFVFFWRRKKFLEEKKNFGGEKNLKILGFVFIDVFLLLKLKFRRKKNSQLVIKLSMMKNDSLTEADSEKFWSTNKI